MRVPSPSCRLFSEVSRAVPRPVKAERRAAQLRKRQYQYHTSFSALARLAWKARLTDLQSCSTWNIKGVTMESQASNQPSLVRSNTTPMVGSIAFERHYCVTEVAQLWGLSERTIRRIFSNEPGVFRWESSETRFKRAYTTLRIPESVVQRVHRKLRKAG